MKQLILIRHAKSSWDNPNLADFDRPLNQRGNRDAPRMGQYLHEQGIHIDQMISSSAFRAIATTQLIAKEMHYPIDQILTKQSLYCASATDLFRATHQFNNDHTIASITAHDPGISQLSSLLSQNKIQHMPTSAIAKFTFKEDDWKEIKIESGQLVLYSTPKILRKQAPNY